MDRELLKAINAAYRRLQMKASQLSLALSHKIFESESGWYNGHYHKDDAGNWCVESYPIYVININKLCDIEIQFDRISVSTKMKRDAALAYSFEKFTDYEFEAYGVDDYLADFYHAKQTVEELKENIRACDEVEIGFSFTFPFEIEVEQILEFVQLLRHENFYY